MKAEHLRLGNLVIDTSFEDRITEISYGDYDADTFEHLDPILLTEDWLLKFGFEKGDGLFRYGLDGTSDIMISPLGDVLIKEYVVKCFIPLCTKLKYVHQLQNLYFALTGEELRCSSLKTSSTK